MTPRTEAIKDISKGRVVVVTAGSGAEADQPSWRREPWTGGLKHIHNPWAAGLREGQELGAVPGIWGHPGHQDHPCDPSVPSLCEGTDLDPSSNQVVAWGRGLGHHASSP